MLYEISYTRYNFKHLHTHTQCPQARRCRDITNFHTRRIYRLLFKCLRCIFTTLNSLQINAYRLCELQIMSLFFFVGIAYPKDMETSLRLSSSTSVTSCTRSRFHHSLSIQDKR